jgi:hypothetical protein
MSGSELVRQSRRTWTEFQKDFIRTADQLDERVTVSSRQVSRWMTGCLDGLPYPASCRVLEKMFGESAERLFGPPDPARRVEVATVEVLGSVPGDHLAMQREVAMAASESAHFGQFAEQSNVGPHTLEQFRADLVRIVTNYPNRPVYPLFVEVRALRNRAFELLEGRQYPEQSRELYLVAGALCGVLANASFDLGWLPAAETQARTAFLCAELAGNNALRAWIRGMQSLVAYWDERPRAAVELARTAGVMSRKPGRPGSGWPRSRPGRTPGWATSAKPSTRWLVLSRPATRSEVRTTPAGCLCSP